MNQLHDSEKVVGRITVRGQWDRRYRVRYEEPPEPVKVDPMREVAKVLGLVIFILVMWVAVFVYVAIAGAAQ
jgi:hypothetical protein